MIAKIHWSQLIGRWVVRVCEVYSPNKTVYSYSSTVYRKVFFFKKYEADLDYSFLRDLELNV